NTTLNSETAGFRSEFDFSACSASSALIVDFDRGHIMRTPFTGAGTALVTPFTRSGDLDEAAVRRLARRQIDAGIHFLSPCGTTGENPTLTAAERLRIV